MKRPAIGFGTGLALAVAGGVALRLLNALALAPPVELFGDGWFFHEVGRLGARGEGYLRPAPFIFEGERIATAEHPPLFTLAAAALTKLGVTGEEAQRALLGSLLGGATIAVLGLARSGWELPHERGHAREYAESHAGRVPPVVAARVGRALGLFRPIQTAGDNEGRRRAVQLAGVAAFYPLLVMALAGAVALRRRRRELALLLAPVLLALIVAAGVYGSIRLRHSAEIGLVLLAAAWTTRPGR